MTKKQIDIHQIANRLSQLVDARAPMIADLRYMAANVEWMLLGIVAREDVDLYCDLYRASETGQLPEILRIAQMAWPDGATAWRCRLSERTAIEWCDATLNLWTGCTKVSDGCKFCYAERMRDGRFGKGEWGPTGTRQEVKSWRSTLAKIAKRAKAEGRRLRVFCQSMSDTFEVPK